MFSKSIVCFYICISIICIQIPASDWMGHWFKALEYQNQNENNKSIDEYTFAINFFPKTDDAYIYNLHSERGYLYLKNGYSRKEDYKMAIEDFNTIINSTKASKDMKSNAILGHAQANLALGNIESFQNDIKKWEMSEPFCTGFQENKGYIVFRLADNLHCNKNLKKAFIQMLVSKHYIDQESDVFFTCSGMAVIKKSKEKQMNWESILNCSR